MTQHRPRARRKKAQRSSRSSRYSRITQSLPVALPPRCRRWVHRVRHQGQGECPVSIELASSMFGDARFPETRNGERAAVLLAFPYRQRAHPDSGFPPPGIKIYDTLPLGGRPPDGPGLRCRHSPATPTLDPQSARRAPLFSRSIPETGRFASLPRSIAAPPPCVMQPDRYRPRRPQRNNRME